MRFYADENESDVMGETAFLQLPRCIKVVYGWLNNRFYFPPWKRHRKSFVSIQMQENLASDVQNRLHFGAYLGTKSSGPLNIYTWYIHIAFVQVCMCMRA